MRWIFFALLLGFGPSVTAGLRYLPANEAQLLIRRDLLPLDTDAIRELAGQLAVLADGPFPKSASQIRHRSQLLTLSLRLLPSQARARAIEETSRKGEDRPYPHPGEVQRSKEAILSTADWLTLLPDDSPGHHLGQLLLDIMQPVVIDNPLLARRSVQNAPNRWNKVVARVTEFEVEDQPLIPRGADPQPSNGKEYATVALLTEIPMISSNEEGTTPPVPGLVITSLVLTRTPSPRKTNDSEKHEKRAPGQMVFKPQSNFEVTPLHRSLLDFFETHQEPLPLHYNLNVNFGTPENKRTYLSHNRENLAAPLAMMLDSAVTGRPLRRNTLFFARLRPSGKLEKPAQAWELLLHLETLRLPGKTRLIVGSGMLEEMTGLLVLDKASFFTRFEVLEAPTFEDARALYFEDGSLPEDLQAAHDGYLEVREKADEAHHLGNFLSLTSVEKRLVRARDFSPRHLSARMLATQAIRRPTYFTRPVAAEELDRLLDPVSRFRFVIGQTKERDVKEAYQAAREAIDPLERYLELGEKELLTEAVMILKKLNAAGRDASPESDSRQKEWQKDVSQFQGLLEEYRLKLRQIYDPKPFRNK
jgi:hypothetical protein